MLNFVEQSAHDIRYYLIEGAVDINQFTVIDQSECTWNGARVTFGILAESHFVSVTKDNHTLTEICACRTLEELPPAARIIHESTIHKMHKPITYADALHHYSFHAEIEAFISHTEPSQTEGVYILHCAFPSAHTEQEQAYTNVMISNSQKLKISTVHTYPNENQAVLTQSVFSTIM